MEETIKIQAEVINTPVRTYKDRVFRMIFKEKKEFLGLYNAMNESAYDNPEDLVVTTLEDVNLYGTRLVRIPEPKFVVFYNGTGRVPERQILRLSDMYEGNPADVALELKTLVFNINLGCNKKLMER